MNTRKLVQAMIRFSQAASDGEAVFFDLGRWVAGASIGDLWRLNAFAVADALHLERIAVLTACIKLVHAGLFELNWDFHCTECNAVAGTHRHLKEATSQNHCPLCDIDFWNDLNGNVEVTFTPSPRLFAVPRRFLAKQGEAVRRLHAARQIRLPDVYVTGNDCLHVPLFREVFETEALSLRESLRIGQVCIMFTDIKGSTAIYDRLGDSVAYGLVRSHFEILFHQIDANGGVIIKTIGDAVMASFTRPADGVRCALAIQKACAEFNCRKDVRNEILVKVGVHSGSTIMVNLNNRLDYFGQTVNMAARVQAEADGGEVVISEALREDPETVRALRGEVDNLSRRIVNLKGIGGSQAVYRLNLKHRTVEAGAGGSDLPAAPEPGLRLPVSAARSS
ncbi:MAG TPA: adenylate/guanylate cyclase domain-containing protein [Spirochaetia bacterium]|nr:adenylate/guanylate cyclase domain-containing protein [Spirochaetia bacterium]